MTATNINMDTIFRTLIYIICFVFGSSVWSFAYNASLRYSEGKDFLRGRSCCPACKSILKPYHLIPIFGYICLKGKCAFCKSKISPIHLITEISGGIIALYSVSNMFDDQNIISDTRNILFAVALFLLVTVLFAVSVIDIITMEIPDGCILLALLFSILCSFSIDLDIFERIIGFFTSSSVYFLISLVVKDAFGFGDVKLSAVLGIFFGWKLSLVSLFFSILTGGLYGVFLLLSSKKSAKDHFAFAPFICLSVIITLITGDRIVSWYENMLSYF